jgi:hypothetical protein
MRSDIFSPRDLDDPDHVESVGEIRVLAQRALGRFWMRAARSASADLLTGQSASVSRYS